MNFFEFIQTNLAHVAPLILMGGFAIAVIVDRVKALFKEYPIQDVTGFMARVSECVIAGKTSEALAICDQYSTKPAARVVKSALTRAHLSEDLIQHGIDLSLAEEAEKISKRTPFLATIANVATLLGLFGTIAGLIRSFEAVGHADPQQKSAMLANGIATAMNATMLGLGIAIPCMLAYSFFMNRQNKLISELYAAGTRVVDSIQQSFYAAENGNQGTSGNTDREAA